jgi:ATP synthase protein I
VNAPDRLPDPALSDSEDNHSVEASPEADASIVSSSMEDYYRLQRDLLLTTLAGAVIIFASVWVFYSLNIALNYLLGACTGVIYLRMLAKNVEQIGRQSLRLGNTRLALLIVLIVVASQWNQLQILPIFLGFLTYKAALIVYVLWTSFAPSLD